MCCQGRVEEYPSRDREGAESRPLADARGSEQRKLATERLLIAKGRSPVVKAKEILTGQTQAGGEPVCRTRQSRPQQGGMPMQFGIFYEIQMPKPWYETKEFETYRKAITFA